MATGASILASSGTTSDAGVDMYNGQWHYSLTPYAWFSNINQMLQFNSPLGRGKSVSVDSKTVESRIPAAGLHPGYAADAGGYTCQIDYSVASLLVVQ
jgi:hypothetical protein